MKSSSYLNGKTILLVDDDEAFREALTDTLTTLGMTVIIGVDGQDGLKVLARVPSIEVILSDIRMPNMDGVSFLTEVRKSSQIPFVLQTGFSDLIETIESSKLGATGFLSKPYTLQDLKKVLSGIFAPVAKKEETKEEDFAKISVDDFISGRLLDCNIFVRLSENRFVKIADKGEDLDMERVQSYKQRGIRYLYLKKADFRNYLAKSVLISKKISGAKTIDPKSRLKFLRHTGSIIVEKVLVEDLDRQAISAATDFFQSTLEVISEQDDFFKMLTLLDAHSDHTYAHSVGVSIYAIMIAQAIGWTSNPTVFRVGLSGMLHDIGLKEIDKKILDTPRALLSRNERMTYESHPARGGEILASCESIPEEVAQAVRQHHENPLGTGYPRGVKGKDIAPLAQIIQVADYFCEYCIKNPDYPKGMSAHAAVERMKELNSDALEPKFFEALQALIKAPG